MRCYQCNDVRDAAVAAVLVDDEAEVAVVAAWLCARCAASPILLATFTRELRRAFPHATERLAFQPREGFEYLRPRLIANGWPGDAAPPVSPMPESRP